ncbi:hypothetical protein OSJ17_25350, partial [Mycobacterium ulcerans]
AGPSRATDTAGTPVADQQPTVAAGTARTAVAAITAAVGGRVSVAADTTIAAVAHTVGGRAVAAGPASATGAATDVAIMTGASITACRGGAGHGGVVV